MFAASHYKSSGTYLKLVKLMLTKTKDLSKFTQGGRGVILELFVKKENCQKSSKYGKEGGVKCFYDRCPKLFTFFF